MCTPNTIAGVVNVLKTTVDAGKKALDIANELNNVELKEAILALKEDNLALREENLALKELLSKKQEYNMQFSSTDNCYYDMKEDGTKEGPYCSNCYDVNNLTVRMIETSKGYYQCPNCKTSIHVGEYEKITSESFFKL